MKKRLVLGMVATVLLSTAIGHAASVSKVNVKESLTEYTLSVKKAAFGGSHEASGLSGKALKDAQNKIINELELSSSKNSSLSMALSDTAKAPQRMESLATVIAAKKMATEIAKVDVAEGKSIEAAANASVMLISNSSLTGARTTAKELSTTELADVTSALVKLETLPEAILTKFDARERDSYTAILNKHDQLIESAKKGSSEEAFVQAIMDVKKVDRVKALEMVKKLKECV